MNDSLLDLKYELCYFDLVLSESEAASLYSFPSSLSKHYDILAVYTV